MSICKKFNRRLSSKKWFVVVANRFNILDLKYLEFSFKLRLSGFLQHNKEHEKNQQKGIEKCVRVNFTNILQADFTFTDPKSTNNSCMGIKLNEIYTRYQFHQCFMHSFCTRGAQKHKKDSQVVRLFTLLGSARAKAPCK